MSEFKGTKGNWSLQGTKSQQGSYPSAELKIDFSEYIVNCVSVYCEDIPTEEDIANAKLIAAAPDLLEAAKMAYVAIRHETNPNNSQLDAYFKLEAAIKKATEL